MQTIGRLGVVAAAVLGALALATPASAHVSVNPSQASQGGSVRLAFRVPTESDTASTTKVEVYLPKDAPVGEVTTMPVPGWTVSVARIKLDQPIEVEGSPVTEAVSTITWTAGRGAGIKPGQFEEFPVDMGPLPKTDQMVFKVLQTYSDGTIVRWIDDPSSGDEAGHPAPALALTAGGAAGPTAAEESTAPAVSLAADPAQQTDSTRSAEIGFAALGVGLAALALALVAVARTRRTRDGAA